MTIRVIVQPAPIVAPEDVPGPHAGDDSKVRAAIAAATSTIDGPNGMLQRALGAQTLQLTLARVPLAGCDTGDLRLPMPPLIAVEQIVSVDGEGEEITLDPSAYRVRGVGTDEGRISFRDGWPVNADEVRITYRAGYDGETTGPVPANAKAAVVLLTQDMQAGSSATGGERSFQVDGAFTESYNSPDQVQRMRNGTVKSLLASLRVFR